MGCGASTASSDHVSASDKRVAQAQVQATEKPILKEAPSKIADTHCASANNSNECDTASILKVQPEESQVDTGEQKVTAHALVYPQSGHDADTKDVLEPATPMVLESAPSAGQKVARSEEPEVQRTSQHSRVQEPQDSPKTARFEGDEEADTGNTPQAAPHPGMVAFKSSRSLNRSFGVRRRTSDAGSQGSPSPGEAAAMDDDAADSEPDPLREEFERRKSANPWLVGVTQKSNMNGLQDGRASDKSKTSKRPSVGFALKGDGDDDGEGTDNDDVDPEAHMEAERIASIVVPREELPAPVPAVSQSSDGTPPVEGGKEEAAASA